jgi:hypothetical protein
MQTEDITCENVVELVDELVSSVPDNREEIAVSIIKDLLQISRSDGAVLPQEEASMQAVAEARFGERAERVIELAEKTVKYEEALVNLEDRAYPHVVAARVDVILACVGY